MDETPAPRWTEMGHRRFACDNVTRHGRACKRQAAWRYAAQESPARLVLCAQHYRDMLAAEDIAKRCGDPFNPETWAAS